MHTGDLLVEMLIGYGVEFVFGMISGHWPLYDAIHRRPDKIRHILVRDERNAAYAADGYARVSNKVGVCDATLGPGAIKLVSGLIEAYNSSVPVLSISDDLPQEWMHLAERGCAARGMEQLRILEPVTKWATLARSQARLPEVLRQALARATSGRPGPVALSIPVDVFCQEWVPGSPEAHVAPEIGRFPASRVCPAPDDVERAIALLQQAARPIILAGGGVNVSAAHAALRAFAEATGTPVATTVAGKGCIAETSALSAGVAGVQYGEECANTLLREADLFMLVGCKSSQQTFNWALPTAGQKVIHMDIAPEEIGKIFRTEVGLVADARAGLQSLLAAASDLAWPDRDEWHQRARHLKEAWERQLAAEMASVGKPIRPQAVMAELRRLTGPDDVVVTDASFSIGWAASFLDAKRDGQKFLFPRGAAGLGFGLGAAMGARLARPEGNVVLITGDGGFAYCLMELATLAKYDLRIVVIVLNNSALSYNRMVARLRGESDFQSVTFPDVNFAQVADGLGCTGMRVEDPGALAESLARAFRAQGPVVVEVVSDGWQTPELTLRQEMQRLAGTKGEDS